MLRTHRFISAVRTGIRGVGSCKTVFLRYNKFLEVYIYKTIYISFYIYNCPYKGMPHKVTITITQNNYQISRKHFLL